ncbi:putative membrane protein [Microbacterium resistens]|uniref:Membrane protein n=1 Tax=Microbacterium resistens TaxID=156977 RepID=A0ABU1S7H9_9MICO|nr:DUF1345 domain-containing protein [Microbacterium resistens]MDR6865579.1 putative membrane protein [Microbacterium resistens]
MTRISRRHLLRIRALVSVLVGIGAGVATTPALGLAAGILAGWGGVAAVSVTWVLLVVWRMDPAQTRAHATVEDPGHSVARFITIVGSVVSLAAVLVVVIQARNEQGPQQFLLAGVAVLSVAASWALIQVDYMLRYARLYYAKPVGGIVFNQDEDPEYTDFAYFSVGLGMTYQVADTNVTDNAFRRIVIAQTLLAYLFGAVILGTIINLITGLG